MTVCIEIGCPELATGAGRCDVHRRARQRAARRSPSGRITGTVAWRALRDQVLARDRWRCVRCGAPAKQVHHREPVSRGGAALPHPSELESLCLACHGAAHRRDVAGGLSTGASPSLSGAARGMYESGEPRAGAREEAHTGTDQPNDAQEATR